MANGFTVLIVDDDAECVTRIGEVLKNQNYNVQESGSAPCALQALNAYPFDLVILNLFIPMLDVVETLKRIKQIDRTLPVLVMSAGHELEKVAEAILSGAYDYLTKPIDCERLPITVRNALMTRRLHKEVMALQQKMSKFVDVGNGNGEVSVSEPLAPEFYADLQTAASAPGGIDLKAAVSRSRQIIPLREIEKALLRQALKISNYNMSSAASSLGIGRTTLYRKLHKYQIPLPR